ncbi:hypothetical protein ACFYTF_04580 [Nocardia thailandica]|uniref:Uncharacterized protein n=1 Tax=Nocardia thailandica TaxID=257275 RepID=A0ABW6PI73_9NOCA
MESIAPNTTVLRRWAASARARLSQRPAAVTAAGQPDSPTPEPPALAQLREDERAAYRELTRRFAEERGLAYVPAFNMGYGSWPEDTQLEFDALAEAHHQEWDARKAALLSRD